MRNKWKRAYDDKCRSLLGMNHQSAMTKLERKMLLHFGRQLGYGDCHQCGFPIEDESTMSVEHVNSWGGNIAKNIDPNVDNFWDVNNIRLSHKRCNASAGCGGSGKYKYTGVHLVYDKRHKTPKEKARASISIGGQERTLGEYTTPEEAAIAYDLALIINHPRMGKLNFEPLREQYQKELNNYNTDSDAFWSIRNGPIKRIVKHFYTILTDYVAQ